MFTQDREMKLENKLFIVGSTKSKGSVDLNRILVTTELAYDYSPALLNKYSMEEILKPLDTKEVLMASITLAQKIVKDMKLDDMHDADDKEEGFRFSFGKYPLIQLSQPYLSTYYIDVYTKFIDKILGMKHSAFMDREKFDTIIQEAMGNLERIFIWHIDFDSPMTLDMYLKFFTEEMDTDEDNMFNMYIYNVYDIEPSVIRLFPWYDIKKVNGSR